MLCIINNNERLLLCTDGTILSEGVYLVNKGMVHEVRAADAEVENVNLLQDGIIKGVQKPRGVRNLGGEMNDVTLPLF